MQAEIFQLLQNIAASVTSHTKTQFKFFCLNGYGRESCTLHKKIPHKCWKQGEPGIGTAFRSETVLPPESVPENNAHDEKEASGVQYFLDEGDILALDIEHEIAPEANRLLSEIKELERECRWDAKFWKTHGGNRGAKAQELIDLAHTHFKRCQQFSPWRWVFYASC